MSKLGTGFNKNIVCCCNYINGIHPNDSDGDVGALPPFLHPHWLVHWPEEPAEIPEKPFLGVPLGANLKGENTVLEASSLSAPETLTARKGSQETQISNHIDDTCI